MIQKFKKIVAFLERDFNLNSSYKIAFIFSLVSSVFSLASYFFIGKLIESGGSLQKYGGNYFSFVFIGMGFSTYFTMALNIFTSSIQRAQSIGCFEAIFSSQTDPKDVVFMSSLYGFLTSGLMLIITFIIGLCFFKLDFSHINLLATFIVFFLAIIIFISLGIFSGAGTILFKKGEPFGFIFGGISSFLGGILFPITLFPEWVQKISMIVPLTHILETLRLTILRGYTIQMITGKIIILLIAALILFPASIYFFKWSILFGKKNGTLSNY